MDGPERMKDGMEMQGAELYPHPDARLTPSPAEPLQATSPEQLLDPARGFRVRLAGTLN